MSIDPNQFLMGGGSRSAKFDGIGISITGTIEDISAKQQTDFTTGEPKTWPNGDPMMQVVVRLATSLQEDGDDDGTRNLYIKGKSLTAAVRDAVRKAGAKGLEVGGTLTVTYVADGVSERRGINPPKLYEAEYVKPDPAASANHALGLVEAAPAPQSDSPAKSEEPNLGDLNPEAQALIKQMLAKQQAATPPF